LSLLILFLLCKSTKTDSQVSENQYQLRDTRYRQWQLLTGTQIIVVILRLKMKNSSSPCHEKHNLYQVLIIQNETEVQDESKTFSTVKNSIQKYVISNKLQLRVQNHELKLKTLGTVKPTVPKDTSSATN
jgi:hypothetical protein